MDNNLTQDFQNSEKSISRTPCGFKGQVVQKLCHHPLNRYKPRRTRVFKSTHLKLLSTNIWKLSANDRPEHLYLDLSDSAGSTGLAHMIHHAYFKVGWRALMS